MLAENPDEVHIGGANLRKQIENIRIHGVTPVVAINAFPGDHESEHQAIQEIAARWACGSPCARTSPKVGGAPPSWPKRWQKRPRSRSQFQLLYPDEASLREKIETVATGSTAPMG